MGVRTGVFTGLVQLAGYVLLSVGFARGLGYAVALLLLQDGESVLTSWWWPAWSVAVAILAELVQFRAAGRLQLLALTAGERTAALKCNLLAGDEVFCFKIAYDEAYARFSPGVQAYSFTFG